jgi:hypothetical protein
MPSFGNTNRQFVWTAAADSILAKIARFCSTISGSRIKQRNSQNNWRNNPNYSCPDLHNIVDPAGNRPGKMEVGNRGLPQQRPTHL